MLTVLHEGLVHVPKCERDVFIENGDHWWNTRCVAEWDVLVSWSLDQLVEGAVITCWWCLVDVLAYKARYGRYPL